MLHHTTPKLASSILQMSLAGHLARPAAPCNRSLVQQQTTINCRGLNARNWTDAREVVNRRSRARSHLIRPAQRPSLRQHRCSFVSTDPSLRYCLNVPHVRRRLDRGNVFQDSVGNTDYANYGTGNDAVPAVTNSDASDEDVDYVLSVGIVKHGLGFAYRYHGRGRRT